MPPRPSEPASIPIPKKRSKAGMPSLLATFQARMLKRRSTEETSSHSSKCITASFLSNWYMLLQKEKAVINQLMTKKVTYKNKGVARNGSQRTTRRLGVSVFVVLYSSVSASRFPHHFFVHRRLYRCLNLSW